MSRRFENEDRLALDGNVVLVDREATLKAPSGWYDRRTGEARLLGGVTGVEKKQRLAADEATYERDSMVVHARGNVHGWDDENRIELTARSVDWFRKTKVAVATGDPVLRSKDDDGKETLLRALMLRVNSETKIAEAIDSVSVERDTMRASGQYARFDDQSGQGILLGSPRAWDGETVVTGDTLQTYAVRRKLERVVVLGNATMDYAGTRETNRGETSRLTGERVDVYVKESRIDSLMATGSARNAYGAAPKSGKTAETNVATGDTILVYFKDKKIDRARVQGGAKGEYHAPVAVGDTTAARVEIVQYDGRHIDFVVPKNQIVLDGQAHLTYRDMELRARRVVFDSDKNTLVAEGKPELVDKGEQVEGQLMTYNLDSRVGTIYQASTSYERGLYHGEQIRKSGDNQLDVLGGSYSTCDLDPPHYHFSARWMKIYLRDKLVAKPVVFYLRNVPVLALPFYVFPIKPGRHSGFLFPQFEFGFNNQGGQFLRNAGYYWAPNDYFDVTGAVDYYQAQPAYAARLEGSYRLLYAFDGNFQSRFERNDLTQRDDYLFSGSHAQTIGERTRLTAQGNFVSSREYNASGLSGSTLAQRLNRFLTSNISLSHVADWASFSALVDRRQDLDADLEIADPDGRGPLRGKPKGTFASLPSLTTSEPSVSVSFPTRTLGSYGLIKDTQLGKTLASTYFGFSSRFLSQRTRRAFVSGYEYFANDTGGPDSTTTLGVQASTRRAFASQMTLTDSRRLFGWLNFAPSLFSNAVVFDFDETGRKLVPAATWQANLGMGTTLYRTIKPPVIRGLSLRHIVSPSASMFYSPEFRSLTFRDTAGLVRNRFNGFGGFDISGFRASRVQFGIDQRFQARYQHGESVMKLDNLLGWSTSGGYDFLWRQHKAKHGLSPLQNSIRLQPPGLLYGDASGTVDIYEGRPLRNFGYSLGLNAGSRGYGVNRGQSVALASESRDAPTVEQFRETWQLSFAYSYSGGYAGPSWGAQKTANAVLRYAFTPNWVIDYSTAYDFSRRLVLSQRFSLSRRIHCWDAVFTRSFTPGGQTEYYLRLGIRDQHEIFYERGSRVQSFGGIQ